MNEVDLLIKVFEKTKEVFLKIEEGRELLEKILSMYANSKFFENIKTEFSVTGLRNFQLEISQSTITLSYSSYPRYYKLIELTPLRANVSQFFIKLLLERSDEMREDLRRFIEFLDNKYKKVVEFINKLYKFADLVTVSIS
mgnify:CR=1 FL=1